LGYSTFFGIIGGGGAGFFFTGGGGGALNLRLFGFTGSVLTYNIFYDSTFSSITTGFTKLFIFCACTYFSFYVGFYSVSFYCF
jgi:hypothetical protein